MEVILSESEKFICLTVKCDDEKSLSWEQLQEIKDKFYPDKDFIEVYPRRVEIINKANERHLIHQKNIDIPKLWDMEEDCFVSIQEI